MSPAPLKSRLFNTYSECVSKTFPPCCVNLLCFAGTLAACRVCEPYMVSYRENAKWARYSGFYYREGLSAEQDAQVRDAIAAAVVNSPAPKPPVKPTRPRRK